MTGLTHIADVYAYEEENGKTIPTEGILYYRGIDTRDIVNGFLSEKRFGFEEVTYLLLTGDLPNKHEYEHFFNEMSRHRGLPQEFIRDIIMEAPSPNVMNALARAVLTLYAYDKNPDSTAPENVMLQSLALIATFPALAAYAYHAYNHFHNGESLFVHIPPADLSAAETLLYLLRPDQKYTDLEARILDLSLVLHADHGGGNNSTFTTRVVTSTDTDTYSAIAAALCSLKGPRHGGANIKVSHMFDDLKAHVSDWQDEKQITDYLEALLAGTAFDRKGLIYGIGHAVYSVSDPRAEMLRAYLEKLSVEKGVEEEFGLYTRVATLASNLIMKKRNIYKGVSPNIDFYSGFLYRLLGLPEELFTPLFAVARISGWCAHRLEEISAANKIIRPAYRSVSDVRQYVAMSQRPE